VKKTFITGASGTGKTTMVQRLSEKDLAAVDMDTMGVAMWQSKTTGEPSEWIPDAGDEWHNEHDWIVSADKLDHYMAEYNPQVIAGLAANQSEVFDRFDRLILLTCSEKTFLRRIEQRVGNRYGKDNSERSRILRTYKAMEREMIGHGAIVVDTDGSLDRVVEDVRSAIGAPTSCQWRPSPRCSAK
jgi:dephospho-CoA kinase